MRFKLILAFILILVSVINGWTLPPKQTPTNTPKVVGGSTKGGGGGGRGKRGFEPGKVKCFVDCINHDPDFILSCSKKQMFTIKCRSILKQCKADCRFTKD